VSDRAAHVSRWQRLCRIHDDLHESVILLKRKVYSLLRLEDVERHVQIHLPRLAHWKTTRRRVDERRAVLERLDTTLHYLATRVVERQFVAEHIGRDLKLQRRFVVPRAIEIARIR